MKTSDANLANCHNPRFDAHLDAGPELLRCAFAFIAKAVEQHLDGLRIDAAKALRRLCNCAGAAGASVMTYLDGEMHTALRVNLDTSPRIDADVELTALRCFARRTSVARSRSHNSYLAVPLPDDEAMQQACIVFAFGPDVNDVALSSLSESLEPDSCIDSIRRHATAEVRRECSALSSFSSWSVDDVIAFAEHFLMKCAEWLECVYPSHSFQCALWSQTHERTGLHTVATTGYDSEYQGTRTLAATRTHHGRVVKAIDATELISAQLDDHRQFGRPDKVRPAKLAAELSAPLYIPELESGSRSATYAITVYIFNKVSSHNGQCDVTATVPRVDCRAVFGIGWYLRRLLAGAVAESRHSISGLLRHNVLTRMPRSLKSIAKTLLDSLSSDAVRIEFLDGTGMDPLSCGFSAMDIETVTPFIMAVQKRIVGRLGGDDSVVTDVVNVSQLRRASCNKHLLCSARRSSRRGPVIVVSFIRAPTRRPFLPVDVEVVEGWIPILAQLHGRMCVSPALRSVAYHDRDLAESAACDGTDRGCEKPVNCKGGQGNQGGV